MYQYDHYDKQLLRERVQQFREQTQRYLDGKLSEEAFLPLRLQNGLYIQRLAPMLRVAVPYGMLSSDQLRKLADICRRYDKGYCHITTRQNIQFNWPQLEAVPNILAELAEVEMHSIQTSGNCIRNVTSDAFAAIADDEVADPRPYCEMVRQWSTLHPEFAFLPRKFKIAITGSIDDRAALQFHDIGLRLTHNDKGEMGFQVFVGGGQGRTPIIAPRIRDFLPQRYLLSYLCAILRIYNRLGRRDNKYKARIKILVKAMGVEEFRKAVEVEWLAIKDNYSPLRDQDIELAKQHFSQPKYQSFDKPLSISELGQNKQPQFKHWLMHNVRSHKSPGYCAAVLSLKTPGKAPGDITDEQLEAVANLADRYSYGEVRTTHQQNIVLADVRIDKLYECWQAARNHGLVSPNINTLTDIICCPGGDFCALANAKSIPVANVIQQHFDDLDYVYDLGELSLNISGCMNACAHHHTGNIGILGVDKKGEEFYQVTLGGSEGRLNQPAAIGKVLGPAFSRQQIPSVIQSILKTFVALRIEGEHFLNTLERIGMAAFKEQAYASIR
ncbi:nitrite/sulfite reductase [Maricurvus nonylphenolicus]|uniref:nitrite/sulfite reductase n=1 Tax=Maricurvus nonylphenolicus TaxID=1008307 RepID=UPI0036F3BE5E